MASKMKSREIMAVAWLPFGFAVMPKESSAVKKVPATTFTKDAMQSALEKHYDITLSSDPSGWIRILTHTESGYVADVSIDGQYTTSGESFRTNCLNLRSAAFSVKYDQETQVFTIVTEGYGHGVGMSQWGANYYATKDGMTYEDILKHYYTGVEIGGFNW